MRGQVGGMPSQQVVPGAPDPMEVQAVAAAHRVAKDRGHRQDDERRKQRPAGEAGPVDGSGAGRTGLSSLIELTAAGSAGDAFVAVALAGTVFFNTSLHEARSQVVLYLILTMTPFALRRYFWQPASMICANGTDPAGRKLILSVSSFISGWHRSRGRHWLNMSR